MAEPLDTIRRVNSDEPMSACELQAALQVLDPHLKTGKADVLGAHRRVLRELERLGVSPQPTSGQLRTQAAATAASANEAAAVEAVAADLRSGREIPPAELLEMEDFLEVQVGRHGNDMTAREALRDVRRVITRSGARDKVKSTTAPAAAGRSVVSKPTTPNRTPSGQAAVKSSGNSALGVIVLLVIVGFVVYGCTHMGSGSGSGSGTGGGSGNLDATTRELMAYDPCKAAVSAQLKAPSTADFQSRFSVDYSLTKDLVTVSGYVDAQNSFGAKLRNDWLCTATVSTNGDISDVQAVLTTP